MDASEAVTALQTWLDWRATGAGRSSALDSIDIDKAASIALEALRRQVMADEDEEVSEESGDYPTDPIQLSCDAGDCVIFDVDQFREITGAIAVQFTAGGLFILTEHREWVNVEVKAGPRRIK